MTEHAGVVRDEEGLRTGLAELAAIEKRMEDVGVHPDIAGFQDLAHASTSRRRCRPHGPRSRRRWSGGRRAAVTTAATTRT
ncbi:hypothetical protein [Streptomyces werraensis]|uniref:hypothetical protein n=1 Tax=Streptomyces werraensis TaxID=68284 RepID=UPI00367F91DC